jgi:hypothetical protein
VAPAFDPSDDDLVLRVTTVHLAPPVSNANDPAPHAWVEVALEDDAADLRFACLQRAAAHACPGHRLPSARVALALVPVEVWPLVRSSLQDAVRDLKVRIPRRNWQHVSAERWVPRITDALPVPLSLATARNEAAV